MHKAYPKPYIKCSECHELYAAQLLIIWDGLQQLEVVLHAWTSLKETGPVHNDG